MPVKLQGLCEDRPTSAAHGEAGGEQRIRTESELPFCRDHRGLRRAQPKWGPKAMTGKLRFTSDSKMLPRDLFFGRLNNTDVGKKQSVSLDLTFPLYIRSFAEFDFKCRNFQPEKGCRPGRRGVTAGHAVVLTAPDCVCTLKYCAWSPERDPSSTKSRRDTAGLQSSTEIAHPRDVTRAVS